MDLTIKSGCPRYATRRTTQQGVRERRKALPWWAVNLEELDARSRNLFRWSGIMGFWEESRVWPSPMGGLGTLGKCWSLHLEWFLPSPSALPHRSSPFFFKKTLLNLLQYCFCFMIRFFSHKPYGILAPWPGIESTPRCIRRWSQPLDCQESPHPFHSLQRSFPTN